MKARSRARLPSARKGRAREAAPAAGGSDEARDARFVRTLGAWFDGAARDLPWRRTRDPYAVWLSEVMLQQTRVDTVIPYYERFLRRFPTVSDLASADLDDVLAMWSGLGYYRRARELHLAAREVTERFGGSLPSTAEGLRDLPGIGRYTAGAVASIAFDLREPLVDGNVARVLARVYGIEDDIGGAAGARSLWSLAGRLVPADRPGRFNEALMELGAMVCTPREPRCSSCPVAPACVASATGRQADLPRVTAKRAPPRVAVVAAVIHRGDRVLLAQRSKGGLFGGMWEPPMVDAMSLEEARSELGARGVPAASLRALREAGKVKHVLSHRELDVLVAAASTKSERPLGAPAAPYERLAWASLGDAIGISTLARKILRKAIPALG